MLYTLTKFEDHVSFRLNRNLLYFFCRLRNVNAGSTLNPLKNYFDNDFARFLSSPKQAALRTLFTDFFDTFKSLTVNERNTLISKFLRAQKVNQIFVDTTINCNEFLVSSIPLSLRQPTKSLFAYLFSTTLNSYGKLKEHYKLVFDSLESNICPFCGIELLNKPSIVRQDYDHMLKQSTYAFTSVNMNNLVPTGTECNRINKHTIDAIYFNNARSVFNSPYVNLFNIRISLTGSTPPATIGESGIWLVNITPENEYTRQWEYVYNIKSRYVDNVLTKFYKNWLKELRSYLINRGIVPIDIVTLEAELLSQSNTLITNPTTSLSNIVKGAFFEFLFQYREPIYRASIINYINF